MMTTKRGRGGGERGVKEREKRLTHGCLSKLDVQHCCTTATVVICFTSPDMNAVASLRRSRRQQATGGREMDTYMYMYSTTNGVEPMALMWTLAPPTIYTPYYAFDSDWENTDFSMYTCTCTRTMDNGLIKGVPLFHKYLIERFHCT